MAREAEPRTDGRGGCSVGDEILGRGHTVLRAARRRAQIVAGRSPSVTAPAGSDYPRWVYSRGNDGKGTILDDAAEQLSYSVPGVSCDHCRAAITGELERVPGVSAVGVDLDAKRVTVAGERLDDAAIRDAIDEAGYDVA